MTIADAIFSYLPAKRKNTPSGWIKFNAVCCASNGTSADTRQRGGMIRNSDGVSYHCFNCGFKASYVSGRHLSRKMRQLLQWLNAPDDEINKLAIEALRIQEDTEYQSKISLPVFEEKSLPKGSKSFNEWSTWLSLDDGSLEVPEGLDLALYYIDQRGIDLNDYPLYWSKEMPERVIIPFYYQGHIVGYTARKLTEGKPKYLSEQTPGYVFNLDRAEDNDSPYVLVVEGPMDAISVGGVALLGAEIMDKQAMLIKRLNKTPVLIPDRDKDGLRTIEQAIEQGWAVSFPNWHQDIKDCNDAVCKYGRLFTLYTIFDAIETQELKIRLRMKQWVSSNE